MLSIAKYYRFVEQYLLKTFLSLEIPVYLTKDEQSTKEAKTNLTGHIDILQIRYNKLHILDFKPEKINKEQTITQLCLYAEALSRITNTELKKFKLAFFNNRNYYEFSPVKKVP